VAARSKARSYTGIVGSNPNPSKEEQDEEKDDDDDDL
jgi:hypothetical protein